MNVVKVLHPREYESLLKMIKEKSRYHKWYLLFLMLFKVYSYIVVVFVRPDESFVIV